LARLFTKPANVLVLDEPTNDLDAETLDVLEDILVDYNGTIIMVSHDRAFLDNVVTSTLVFEGNGLVTEHVGGYTDWQQELARIAVAKRQKTALAASAPASAKPNSGGGKLTNKERQELEQLPKKIEQWEAEQADLTAKLAQPNLYKDGGTQAAILQKKLQELEQTLTLAYQKWTDLSGR
jgi:ATP-binding cassette subfamily F protein uup